MPEPFSHFSSDTCGWGHNGWREPIDGRAAWHSGVGRCLKSGHCWDVGSTGRSGQLQCSLLANQASVKRCVRLKKEFIWLLLAELFRNVLLDSSAFSDWICLFCQVHLALKCKLFYWATGDTGCKIECNFIFQLNFLSCHNIKLKA